MLEFLVTATQRLKPRSILVTRALCAPKLDDQLQYSVANVNVCDRLITHLYTHDDEVMRCVMSHFGDEEWIFV